MSLTALDLLLTIEHARETHPPENDIVNNVPVIIRAWLNEKGPRIIWRTHLHNYFPRVNSGLLFFDYAVSLQSGGPVSKLVKDIRNSSAELFASIDNIDRLELLRPLVYVDWEPQESLKVKLYDLSGCNDFDFIRHFEQMASMLKTVFVRRDYGPKMAIYSVKFRSLEDIYFLVSKCPYISQIKRFDQIEVPASNES